jgi:hypothetical protein
MLRGSVTVGLLLALEDVVGLMMRITRHNGINPSFLFFLESTVVIRYAKINRPTGPSCAPSDTLRR